MPGNGHKLCVICLGAEHKHLALKGAGWIDCDEFSLRKNSRLALFTSEESQATEPNGSSSAFAEAKEFS